MSINSAKKSRGRPPVESEAVNVRFASKLLDGIDSYIRKVGEPIGRPEAIRRIVSEYLKRRGLLE
jgi:hypothetical protein